MTTWILHEHSTAANLLQALDLGSSIAEQDTLLESARVETSAFSDLLQDKVDLIPGTKGSGKSALFRIFVDFLPDQLLQQRKVVIAHGVQKHGDNVFQAFNEQFEKLSEDDFVSFWCIYLTSLAHEQFIKGPLYHPYLKNAHAEVEAFRRACAKARIPEIKAQKTLLDILAWTLHVLRSWAPRLTYKLPADGGEIGMDLFGQPPGWPVEQGGSPNATEVPQYIAAIKDTLEAVLHRSTLNIWLMIDRLDEVFLRRSELEARALRGLLRCMRLFSTPLIRVKVFLRDDMLEQVVSLGSGFTALTHITARQADTLRWPEDQILTMLVKRLFADEGLRTYLRVDKQRLEASHDYRSQCFYMVFPATVHKPPHQSPTLRWLYNHTMDGRSVVTPRDVLDLVTRAIQKQQNDFLQSPNDKSAWLIGPEAIQYGLDQLSKRKRDTYLKAEFPHLWPHIEKFHGGKTEYSKTALQQLFGKEWEQVCMDLVSIGLIKKRVTKKAEETYQFPFVYRGGLELSQGRA